MHSHQRAYSGTLSRGTIVALPVPAKDFHFLMWIGQRGEGCAKAGIPREGAKMTKAMRTLAGTTLITVFSAALQAVPTKTRAGLCPAPLFAGEAEATTGEDVLHFSRTM